LPAYTFTGAYPRVLTGLRQGVNARHDGTPPGATIEPDPGDTVTTDTPFDHPELRLDDPNTPPDPAPAPAGEVVLDAEAISHLSPEVLAQIHAAEQETHTDGAPAPEATN
jgi:hypothetical protein